MMPEKTGDQSSYADHDRPYSIDAGMTRYAVIANGLF